MNETWRPVVGWEGASPTTTAIYAATADSDLDVIAEAASR